MEKQPDSHKQKEEEIRKFIETIQKLDETQQIGLNLMLEGMRMMVKK